MTADSGIIASQTDVQLEHMVKKKNPGISPGPSLGLQQKFLTEGKSLQCPAEIIQ